MHNFRMSVGSSGGVRERKGRPRAVASELLLALLKCVDLARKKGILARSQNRCKEETRNH